MATELQEQTRPAIESSANGSVPLATLEEPLTCPVLELRTPVVPRPQRAARFPIRRRKRAKPERTFWRKFSSDVIRGSILIVLINLFVLQVSVVRGQSMQPSLFDGDRLIVDRVSYFLVDVSRYDVVVLRSPLNPEVDYVKRVIGLPGDRVRLLEGQVFVNDAKLQGSHGCVTDFATTGEIVVPVGQYFVLGDNRPISCDSREFGLVAAAALRGRVRARFWPFATVRLF